MLQVTPPFCAANTEFAYQLHYHLGFRTRQSVPVFSDTDRLTILGESLNAICHRNDYHLLEFDTSDTWIRMLLSLRPCCAPSDVVRTLKSNSSRAIFDAFPDAISEMGSRSLWSRGYYLRGIGSVTNETVRQYVGRQSEHHEFEREDSHLLATYEHPNPQSFFDLRSFSHCVAEYNCHLVFCPIRHVPAIDPTIAGELLKYMQQVALKKGIEVISLAVLDDHIHLFAALKPEHSPESLAFAMMNNTSHWIARHNPGAMKVWNAPGMWMPSAFIRTAGAVTTGVVRQYLKGRG